MSERERRTLKQTEQMPRGGTVSDLVDYCIQRGLDPGVVTASGGHLAWERVETDEEAAKYDQWKAASDARKAKWEREQYDRLRAQFEDEPTPPPAQRDPAGLADGGA